MAYANLSCLWQYVYAVIPFLPSQVISYTDPKAFQKDHVHFYFHNTINKQNNYNEWNKLLTVSVLALHYKQGELSATDTLSRYLTHYYFD